MGDVAIRVEGLGKRYKIGQRTGYQRMTEKLTQLLASPLRKKESSDNPAFFWALKDVSFEVKKGEVLGIIGRNGAGKSTLLKILSRITSMTVGAADIFGRIGSLLEVGTGFHPELTGRENIFLNGAILGMKRPEIRAKFDEIVAFAEIEKFLDTPVKHYSSGMYMRLAFAVAAHLEPEILVVDEVLAVGDAAFQTKCLGRMSEVAQSGRTVLFVSHNMGAIGTLCSHAVWLDSGAVRRLGHPETIVAEYLLSNRNETGQRHWDGGIANPGVTELKILSVSFLAENGTPTATVDGRKAFYVEIVAHLLQPLPNSRIGFQLTTLDGTPLWEAYSVDDKTIPSPSSPGIYSLRCQVPSHLLMPGQFLLNVNAGAPGYKNYFYREGILSLHVEDTYGSLAFPEIRRSGPVFPNFRWSIKES